MKRILAILAMALAAFAGGTESLAPPDFKGYLSGGVALARGDTLVVEIDTTSRLTFAASSADDKSFTLEFSGGEAGNLFSFLPQGRTGGDRSTQGGQELELRASMAVVVTQVDSTGRAQVQGSRTLSIEGKQESVSLSGWVHPRDVSTDWKVSFAALADARLVYRTFLGSGRDVLTSRDIQEVLTTVTTPAAPAAAQPAASATAPSPPAGQTVTTRTLSLTDAKKRELLLLYLNRLVDLVFGQ